MLRVHAISFFTNKTPLSLRSHPFGILVLWRNINTLFYKYNVDIHCIVDNLIYKPIMQFIRQLPNMLNSCEFGFWHYMKNKPIKQMFFISVNDLRYAVKGASNG